MASFFEDHDEHYTHMTYHFHCTIPPPSIRVAVLAPKLNWLRVPGWAVLRNPQTTLWIPLYKASQLLRGESGQRRGNLELPRAPQGSCFLVVFLLKNCNFFEDHDEHYTHMTYHFHCTITPPSIRVAVLAPKLILAKGPWVGDP